MKKLLILGLCVLASTSVFADEELFITLDADGDSLISISEAAVDADVSAQFSELDANKDGYLSAEEFANY
ncbi:hypothetical protein [Paraglaciecola sp.]|uniref:hypothetical protein n=1 Tax=Paraglaciecola sp. TaxID=1920173 RepID=UPI0030F3A01E